MDNICRDWGEGGLKGGLSCLRDVQEEEKTSLLHGPQDKLYDELNWGLNDALRKVFWLSRLGPAFTILCYQVEATSLTPCRKEAARKMSRGENVWKGLHGAK